MGRLRIFWWRSATYALTAPALQAKADGAQPIAQPHGNGAQQTAPPNAGNTLQATAKDTNTQPAVQAQGNGDRRAQVIIGSSYSATLKLSLSVLPILMAGASIVLYTLVAWHLVGNKPTDQWLVVAFGAAVGAIIWLALPFASDDGLSVTKANPNAYANLHKRVDELEYAAKAYCPRGEEEKPPRQDHDPALDREAAGIIWGTIHEVKARLSEQHRDLREDPGQWANGTGYVELRSRLHRAEEALLQIAPIGRVVDEATRDSRRLDSSNIPGHNNLIRILNEAVKTLENQPQEEERKNLIGVLDDVVMTLKRPTSDKQRTDAVNILDHVAKALGGIESHRADEERKNLIGALDDVVISLKGTTTEEQRNSIISALERVVKSFKAEEVQPQDEQYKNQGHVQRENAMSIARRRVYTIRCTINEYRDSRYNNLILAREKLARSILWTGLFGLAILALAILLYPTLTLTSVGVGAAGQPQRHYTANPLYDNAVLVAVIYFVVGALIGLINRLRLDGRNTANLDDDYGFAETRLVHTALLSGLSAIGGVVLVSLLPAFAASLTAVNADPVATTEPVKVSEFYLDNIFSLWANPMGLLIAGVFGLSPALFTSTLQKQVDKITDDLNKSKPEASQAQD